MEKMTLLFIAAFMPIMSSAALQTSTQDGQLIMACVIGSVISAAFSFRKSRRNKDAREEAVTTTIIALLSGMAFGYFATPAASTLPVIKVIAHFPPLVGLLLSLAGAQIVELILGGTLSDVLKSSLKKFNLNSHNKGE